MGESLFDRLDDDRYQATDLARGPWSPDALHGGPVAALVAGVAAEVARLEEDSLAPVRLSLELLRPVPVAPLTVTGRLLRPGRKVRLAAVDVATDDGTVATTATLLAIREAAVDVPEHSAGTAPPGAETAQAWDPWDSDTHVEGSYRGFHNAGTEHRFVAGVLGEPGPATDWIRLTVPVIADEPILPLQRVAAAADFGNGIAGLAPFEEMTFINPDLTVALQRLPDGEWVCLDAVSYLEPSGHGLAESVLWDERGRIGHAVQTLILEARS